MYVFEFVITTFKTSILKDFTANTQPYCNTNIQAIDQAIFRI